MKRKVYYFIIHSGAYDQTMHEYTHWACSNEFSSKAALQKAYTHGSQAVKAREIYSSKQMVEKFSKHYLDGVLAEIKKLNTCVFIKEK